jgi:hypothetical protein
MKQPIEQGNVALLSIPLSEPSKKKLKIWPIKRVITNIRAFANVPFSRKLLPESFELDTEVRMTTCCYRRELVIPNVRGGCLVQILNPISIEVAKTNPALSDEIRYAVSNGKDFVDGKCSGSIISCENELCFYFGAELGFERRIIGNDRRINFNVMEWFESKGIRQENAQPMFACIFAIRARAEVFSGLGRFHSISFKSDSRLTRIESEAFSYSSLQSLLIPSNVEILCSECFPNCKSLLSISFESNSRLTRIESSAFPYSSLQLLVIRSRVEILGHHVFHIVNRFHPFPLNQIHD